ncbi:hypothetical protein HDE_01240 [Halotydeus destructor]|nr:hypothetical protein HDE_01240 [Halotydeus destructor]
MKAVFLTLLAALPVVLSITPNCERLTKEADSCIMDIAMVGKTSAPPPNTKPQLTAYCNDAYKKTIPCVRRFTNNCLTPFPRSVFNVGYKLAMRQFKRICFTAEGQTEFVTNAECFQPEHLQVLHRYLDLVTNLADHVARNVTSNEMIPNLCCIYFTVYDRAIKEMSQICGRPAAIEFFIGIIKSVATDLVDIGCGKLSTPQSCYANLPKAMALFDRMSRPENVKRSPGYSPMVPLVKIMHKLDAPELN